MVPGDVLVDVDLHATRLLSMTSTNGFISSVYGALVALEHADAELEDAVGLVDDLGGADELDAAQLVVGVAVLDHARDCGLRRRFRTFCALRLGLERDRTLEEAVPHRDEVDRAVVVDRRADHRGRPSRGTRRPPRRSS